MLNAIKWNLDLKIPTGGYDIPAALHAVAHVPSSGTCEYFVCGVDYVGDYYDHDGVHVTNSTIQDPKFSENMEFRIGALQDRYPIMNIESRSRFWTPVNQEGPSISLSRR